MLKAHFIFKAFFLMTFFLFSFFWSTGSVSAQLQESDISISSNPIFPKPGEDVDVRLISFSTDLDKAFIAWSVDGEERASGVGKKMFSFTIEKDMPKHQVTASVTMIGGLTLNKTIIISSVEVDMLWEATDSYVPPFYKGKAMGVREGGFRVVAIPAVISSRGKVSPSNLSYTWKKDGNVQVSASGFGKNYLNFKNSYLDDINEIEVEISDVENKTKTGGKTIIRGLSRPEIIFYKKDPVFGLQLQQALQDGYQIGVNTETIFVAPYFFSPKNLSSNQLRFNWKAGGQPIQPNRNRNEVSVVAPKNTSGGTDISVLIENTGSLFQSLEEKINVIF